jgi:polysaccharide pyruvyl transferase WcaK-like protein
MAEFMDKPVSQHQTATSFALMSPCGHGNLGDAATLTAVLQNIQRKIPDAEFYGITLRPGDTEKRHGIPSYPIGGISLPGYLIDSVKSRETGITPQLSPGPAQTPVSGIRELVRDLLTSAARLLLPRGWPWIIREEAEHISGAVRLLKKMDMVILTGGGQLDDFWGGAWGQPYALLKWSLLTRLTNTKFVILCTGFGSLDSWVSRLLTRLALRLSDYRSYRDVGSKNLMQQAGFRRDDPVYPDLAFSLDVSRFMENSRLPVNPTRVCISPIVYCDPKTWPIKNEVVYKRYLRKLADVAASLLASGYQLVLVASDGPDNRTIQELRESLIQLVGRTCLNQMEIPPVVTVEDFLFHVSQAQFLVASRLHGVVLAHLVGTPVIALSYDRKVKALMDAMEQMQFCLDIDDFDAEQVRDAVERLQGSMSETRKAIRNKGREFSLRLDGQYDSILSPRVAGKEQ